MENSIISNRRVVAWENAAKMDSSFSGFYLCVEGNTDLNLWKEYTVKTNVRIQVLNGWENVLKRIENQANCIGIIDKDFRDLTDTLPKEKNVFVTDEHDIEMMMFLSCVFPKIIAALKIDDNGLRSDVLEITDDIGLVKLTAEKHNWNLKFKKQSNKKQSDFDYPKYEDAIDKKTFAYLGIEKIIERIITFSGSKSKVSDILTVIKGLDYQQGKLSNGHDFAYVMEYYLKYRHKIKNITAEHLEIIIMSAYLSANLLQETIIYRQIKEYGNIHNIQLLQ